MKLLDIFSGYTATTGSPLVHVAYMVGCSAFTLGILNKGYAKDIWLWLIDRWFYTHLIFFIAIILNQTILKTSKEFQFILLLFAILQYQSLILDTTIQHITYAKVNTLHFFYAEDIVHFLIYLEIMTFCANILTNIVIIMIASLIDVKLIKSGYSDKERKKLEVDLAQVEVMDNQATTIMNYQSENQD